MTEQLLRIQDHHLHAICDIPFIIQSYAERMLCIFVAYLALAYDCMIGSNISIAISLKFLFKRSQCMKLLDIEKFMKDVNVGKVSYFRSNTYFEVDMVKLSTKGISSKLNLSFSTLTSSKKFACAKTFSI